MEKWRKSTAPVFGKKKIVFEVGESYAAVDYVHSLSEMRRANKQVGVGQMLGMRSWEVAESKPPHIKGNSSWYAKWEKQQGKQSGSICWKARREDKNEENFTKGVECSTVER